MSSHTLLKRPRNQFLACYLERDTKRWIFEIKVIKRTMQYIKDRIEFFDDYFPCRKKNCKLEYIKQCLNLFAFDYN